MNTAPRPAFGGILLAAGASTRLGQPKQLLPFRGGTLLGHAARTALAAGCAPLIVVLGFDAERMIHVLPDHPAIRVVRCANWEAGMGATLKAGWHDLLQSGADVSAGLICLCDQPGATAALFHDLIEAQRSSGHPVAASAYGETLGPPAVFGREISAEILALPDHTGAKAVILRHTALGAVARVSFPAGLLDVDTPADLDRLASADSAPPAI